MEISTVAVNLTTEELITPGEVFSKRKLMCLCTPANLAKTEESFPDAQIIHSVIELDNLSKISPEDFPDAVLFFSDSITELFFQQLRYTDKILREYSIPLIVVSDGLDLETKKMVLRNGADDCFTSEIHPEGFVYWIDFLKRFKKFSREIPAAKVEQDNFKISVAKRAFDIVMASIALIIASPVMLIIAILIRLESKGPVFYISKRAGSGYKIFNFLKFRTMVQGADADLNKLKHLNQYGNGASDQVFFKIKNDPRITRLGNFLRNTSLDELPQLINVLRGDMSIVGNRPLPLYEAQQLTKEQSAMRFMTAAGITGLWQVTKRGRGDVSEDERIALDVQYAKTNSFQKDMLLIFKTLPALTQEVAV